MKVNPFFFVSTCFVLCLSAPIFDRKKALEMLNRQLSYVDPTKQVEFLKDTLVNTLEQAHHERIVMDDKVVRLSGRLSGTIGAVQKEKEIADAEAKRYTIPLIVRNYAIIIEELFPLIMNGPIWVPCDIWNHTEVSNRNKVKRKYKWDKLLQEKKGTVYVDFLLEELDKNYKIDHNVDSIDENDERYKTYRLEFCDSIVKAIEHCNTLVAHAGGVGDIKYYTKIFGRAVDKYMVIFYNAMIKAPIPDVTNYWESIKF